MKHFTLEEKFNVIKRISGNCSVGIHNYEMLHDIADALDMKSNSCGHFYSMHTRIIKIMRDLMRAGYPVKEYRIKCCGWAGKETWHPCFKIEDNT